MEKFIDTIEGCRVGNESSLMKVYEQYRGFALKTVFRYIYRYENAVDVMNDGFVKAFKGFHTFRFEDLDHAEKSLMGWLKRIMINTAIDFLRAQKMTPEIGSVNEHIWQVVDNHQNADQLLLYKDIILLVKKLPPLYRSIFNLYVIDGYNHIEIAEMLNIPVGTSKSGLSRARQQLQKHIIHLEDQLYVNAR